MVVVSNATGVLVAPGNFFTANSNLLNQAVNKFQPVLTNPLISSTPFNGLAATLYSPYSLLEYNMTNATLICPVFQTGAQGMVEEEFGFGGLGYYWNQVVTSNAWEVTDVNNHIGLQLINTGGSNNAKIGGNLAVGGILSGLSGLTNANGLPLADASVTNGLAPAIPGGFLSVLENGAVGNGSTDDTAAVQACLNKGGSWEFGTNAYYLREFVIPSNTTIHGNFARLIYATGATNTNIFVRCLLNANCQISGFWLDGGNYADVTTRTYNGYYNGASVALTYGVTTVGRFNYWRPGGQRHGLQIRGDGGGTVHDVVISGFGGAGVIPLCSNYGNPGNWFGPACNINPINLYNVTCYSNLVGFYSSSELGVDDGGGGAYGGGGNWVTNYVPGSIAAQYTVYKNVNCWGNTIGLVNTAANCEFQGCNFDNNYWHEVSSGSGVNNTHGICNGCFFNHTLYNDLYLNGCGQGGEDYSSCWFGGNGAGSITLQGCRGVTFSDCHWDSIYLTNVSSQSGCINLVRNFLYNGAWSSSGIGTDGHLLLEGGYSYDTQPDPGGIGIAASGVTNLGPRQATAVVTASSATFYVTNFYGVCVQTNASATGTWQIPLRYGESVNAASGLSGYLYW
jgi:hypothetical protein